MTLLASETLLTQPELEDIAYRAGFSRTRYAVLFGLSPVQVVAACGMVEGQTVASRERTAAEHIDYTDSAAVGDQALANSIWGYSYGPLQVRSLRSQLGTGKYRDADRLPDPLFNLQSALVIWKAQRAQPDPPLINGARNWTGFEPWSTFMSDAYQAYLPQAFPPPATQYVVKGGDSLSGIAARLGVGVWQDWQQVNQLPNPNLISINEKLDRPWWSYTVAAGDTFAALAALNHLHAATLRTFNQAPRGEPVAGSQLLIPHRLLTRTAP